MNITKKQIKKLANFSFTKDSLDIKKINKITKLLKRKELKIYIKALKNYRNKKTITLTTAKVIDRNSLLKKVKKLFPDKNIVINEDKSLIGGIKIIDYDMIYDSNIKNNLENLTSFLNK